MKYSKDALTELVKVNMEESAVQYGGNNVSVVDGVGIEYYIENKLQESLIKVFIASPSYLLEQIDARETVTPERFQDGSGRIVLPEDLLKMSLFKMRGWRRGVTQFLDTANPVAELQNNTYTMGGIAKPAVIIYMADGGKRVLRYYSLPTELRNHEVEEALYVRIPDLSIPLEINEILLPSVTYTTAAMVY
ncbi:MAG: hypothetical protein RR015_06710, partial [Bacteroidales bacterium]